VARLLLAALLLVALPAAAKPADKIPVAFAQWSGLRANSFKSALRSAVAKECRSVKPAAARVLVEGEVSEKGKGALVRLVLKNPKDGEVVESREFSFPRPQPSGPQVKKMGRALVEMARRAPAE
jgi:hypothetical protein